MRLAILASLLMLSGCEVLPTFMQPTNEVSTDAEETWQSLDAIDTLQTVQFSRRPSTCYREADGIAADFYGSPHPSVSRVLLTNIPLMFAHAAIAAWLDREVDKHLQEDEADPGLDSVGPWYSIRIVFHAVSIGGTSYAVLNNFSNGVTPWKAGCL